MMAGYGLPANVKTQSNRGLRPLVVDEAAFQQLLSAAFVMQEHNARLKKAPTVKIAAPVAAPTPAVISVAPAPPIPFPSALAAIQANSTCQECGAVLAVNEFFCHGCGAPAERIGNTMQKNWSSLWEMHQASTVVENEISKTAPVVASQEQETPEEIDLFPAELKEIVGNFSETGDEEPAVETTKSDKANKGLSLVPITPQLASATPAEAVEPAPAQPSPWTSAAKARVWLDSLKSPQASKDWFQEEWNLHRGIIAIALASAVLLAVVFQWTTRPATAPGQQRELSAFEQLLVSVGLADPPTPPSTTQAAPGNPNTKVWEDLHTALYYCPGADLYGKTAEGKFTTQADAQRDNFQPSTLKACD